MRYIIVNSYSDETEVVDSLQGVMDYLDSNFDSSDRNHYGEMAGLSDVEAYAIVGERLKVRETVQFTLEDDNGNAHNEPTSDNEPLMANAPLPLPGETVGDYVRRISGG